MPKCNTGLYSSPPTLQRDFRGEFHLARAIPIPDAKDSKAPQTLPDKKKCIQNGAKILRKQASHRLKTPHSKKCSALQSRTFQQQRSELQASADSSVD